MKCFACGYQKGIEYLSDKKGVVVLENTIDEFIKIKGQFTIEQEGNNGYLYPKEILLYACPNCSTVQMSKW